MVYSQICSWLDDFIGDEPPLELLDIWDLTEWLNETEILEVFKEVVLPAFKKKQTCDDAMNILNSIIWEYYLFRRNGALLNIKSCDTAAIMGLRGPKQYSEQWFLEKNSIVSASEFSSILDSRSRLSVLRNKTKKIHYDGEPLKTVFLTPENGRLNPFAWGMRYEPVIRALYEKKYGCSVFCELGRLRHPSYNELAATPDGLVVGGERNGRLLEIKAPCSRRLEEEIIPYGYYCQMQIQMEVLNVEAADYCECRILPVSVWENIPVSESEWIGAVAVTDISGFSYVYSPLFPNTDTGRKSVGEWMPEGVADEDVVEKQVWAVQDWQVMTVLRNRRWWSTVLPEYELFIKDMAQARIDPLFLVPQDPYENVFQKPMFLDD